LQEVETIKRCQEKMRKMLDKASAHQKYVKHRDINNHAVASSS